MSDITRVFCHHKVSYLLEHKRGIGGARRADHAQAYLCKGVAIQTKSQDKKEGNAFHGNSLCTRLRRIIDRVALTLDKSYAFKLWRAH